MKRWICLVALVALALPVCALAEDKKADQEAMMKAYMEMAKPGPAHAKLASLAGSWNYTMTMYEDPANPMTSKGTCTSAMVLDGRFLKEETTGEMMGMPFVGNGLVGYNNVTNMYESTWCDNMGTGIIMGTGKETDASTIAMDWNYIDPMTKKPTKVKTVTKIVDANKHTFTWFNIEKGKEVKAFEIEYVRAGS